MKTVTSSFHTPTTHGETLHAPIDSISTPSKNVQEAVEAINIYFLTRGYNDTSIKKVNNGFEITKSYFVKSRYDRLYVSTILSRTEGVDREAIL